MPKAKEWKIKVDAEKDNAPVFTEDGKIVYIDPDGNELPLDPVAMYNKITELNKENQKHREKYDATVDRFKIFDGIEDIAKYKEEADKAINAVTNFQEKDWLKADKVEQLKKEMTDSYNEKLDQAKAAFGEKEKAFTEVVNKKDAQIRTLLVSNKFAVSPYFSGEESKSVLLPEVAESYFSKHFKVIEDDKGQLSVVAYHANGDQILSKVNPGELADFDESIGIIIDNHPQKDHLLRGSTGGSGGGGGGGDEEETNDISKLKKQLAEAQKNRNAALSITLKNKIWELEKKQKK